MPHFQLLITLLLAIICSAAAATPTTDSAPSKFGTLQEFISEPQSGEPKSIYKTTPPAALFHHQSTPAANLAADESPDVSGAASLESQPELPAASDETATLEEQKRSPQNFKLRSATDIRDITAEPWRSYRAHETSLLWTPTDNLGWTSLLGSHYMPAAQKGGDLKFAFSLHWLNGPVAVPLPPRLYDLSLNYQRRGEINEYLSYDVATSIGLYTDFEDSAREGLRFPAHAVTALHANQEIDLIFGIDFLDRDDYSLLPVLGLSMHSTSIRGLRMDLIFPRPRIEYAWDSDTRSYISGQLGGGTWDIELPDSSQDVVTVREYQIAVGTESLNDDGDLVAFELGWVFNRAVEFRTLPGTFDLGDTVLLQWITRRR